MAEGNLKIRIVRIWGSKAPKPATLAGYTCVETTNDQLRSGSDQYWAAIM